VELRLKRKFNTYPNSVEGRRQADWILMDYVDFIVHIFSPEKRAFYGLERLRKSATTLSVEDLNAEIKNAIAAHRPTKTAANAKKVPAKKKTAAKKSAGRAPAKKTATKAAKKASSKTASRSRAKAK
jgi:ribosome-associated protein